MFAVLYGKIWSIKKTLQILSCLLQFFFFKKKFRYDMILYFHVSTVSFGIQKPTLELYFPHNIKHENTT